MGKWVKEIVLTGGPCSGKTTGLAYLTEKLSDQGMRVFTAPEAATIVIAGGIMDIRSIAVENFKKYLEIQREILRIQLNHSRSFRNLAALFPEGCVIIHDRGPKDSETYIGRKHFLAMLKKEGLAMADTCDSFDGVIHLVTAACGAEKFYTLANNEARSESIEEARTLDQKTLNAWIGHPHLKIIDNSSGFEMKMERLLRAVWHILGIPDPLEIERRFLVGGPINPSQIIPSHFQKIQIEQIYILSPENEKIRIRKRTHCGSPMYFKTRKRKLRPRVRRETEDIISRKKFLALKKMKRPNTAIIQKLRYCFVHRNQYFELDVFIEPANVRGLCLLEIELTEENDLVELPPFLKIKREVTDDPAYSNFSIAQRKYS